MRTLLASLTLLLVTSLAAAYERLPMGDYTLEAAIERLSAMPLHAVEGIWQFTDNGAMVVVERIPGASNEASGYRMVIISSPSRSVLPGTVMGTLRTTAKRGEYSATLFTDSDGGSRLLKPKKFTLAMNDDAHLAFRAHGLKIRVRLWRLLPYVSRLGIYTRDDSPRAAEGCVRIYPSPVDRPLEPRYL